MCKTNITIEEVERIAKEKQCKLVSTKYKNCDTHLKFICNICGGEFLQTFYCLKKCKIVAHDRCSYKIRSETYNSNPALTIQHVKEKTEKITEGYKCLSKIYKDNHTKLKFICPKNHIFYMRWNNFYGGQRCPKCYTKNTKLTLDYVKNKTKNIAKGYICISSKYKNNGSRDRNHKLEFKCDKGHIFKMSWSDFDQSNSRCPTCYNNNRIKHDSISSQEEFISYRECINRLSNENFCKYYNLINPNKLKRAFRKFHLDHIFSVSDGFKGGISPKVIASPINLRMLWWKDNISKSNKSIITLEELYLWYEEFNRWDS